MKDDWAKLDDRQRAYLRACYLIDQDRTRHNHAARTRGSQILGDAKAEWLLYGPTLPASPLLHRLRVLHLADTATLTTFRSLELLDILHCQYVQNPPNMALLYIQLTPRGRYVARIGMGLPVPDTLK